MRFIKLPAAFLSIALFSTACGLLGGGRNEIVQTNPYENDALQQQAQIAAEEAARQYARENLDLRAVGALLEKADNAEEFEYLINNEGVNNLDLNGDGYADYISVSEFEDRDGNDERGLSLFSRFGPDLIQEIATIIFDRGGYRDARGARILLTGDRDLYGDDYYYETNWLDRSLPVANWLFDRNRSDYYRSPYYYENYPDNYEVYEVAETPVYRERIERTYYTTTTSGGSNGGGGDAGAIAPVFIQTSTPTVVKEIKIKSPYAGRSVAKDFPKPVGVKPPKAPKEFGKNKTGVGGPPEFVREKKGKMNDVSPGSDDRKGNPNNFERKQKPPRRDESPRFESRERPDNIFREAPKGKGRPDFNAPKPNKVEKPDMKPPKQENNGGGKQKGGGDGNNPGRGNGGGGGGNGGGNGKGGRKKN